MAKIKSVKPKAKSKTRGGATRTPPARTRKKVRWKPIFKGLLLTGLIVVAWQHIDWKAQVAKVREITSRPVAEVIVEGEFKFISKSKIQHILDGYTQQSFMDINLEELRRAMLESPWVEDVKISRVWPDKMIVNVQEQKPIARWGTQGFINRYGNRVFTSSNDVLEYLPQLTGPNYLVDEIASGYLEMSRLLAEKNIVLEGVSVDETGSWVLSLPQEKRLLLGEEGLVEKLELFLLVLETHLDNNLDSIKKVDVRYESGLAIEWLKNENGLIAKHNVRKQSYANN